MRFRKSLVVLKMGLVLSSMPLLEGCRRGADVVKVRRANMEDHFRMLENVKFNSWGDFLNNFPKIVANLDHLLNKKLNPKDEERLYGLLHSLAIQVDVLEDVPQNALLNLSNQDYVKSQPLGFLAFIMFSSTAKTSYLSGSPDKISLDGFSVVERTWNTNGNPRDALKKLKGK